MGDTSQDGTTRVAMGLAAGVTEDMIRTLVHAFYERVRADAALGPIFERAVAGDWAPHLAKMCDFWSSVMLATSRYQGRPMPAHLRLAGIQPAHFARWLELFGRTAEETCPPPAAALFKDRARRIAESFQLGIAFHRRDEPAWRGYGRPGN